MRPHLVFTVLSLSAGCPGPTDDKAPEEAPEEDPEEAPEEAPDDTGCVPAEETCNGLDDDCDGEVDEDTYGTWYRDRDGDGWGGTSREACERPTGYVEVSGDCDDGDPEVNPDGTEACDGIDNDCDGALLSDEVDEDDDGQMVCEGDCDDAEPLVRDGRREICDDGIDNDCEGTVDLDCTTCDTTVADGSSLQDAIDAASSGDTICVGPGSWSGTLDFDGAAISVVSLAGPSETFLERVSFTSSEGGSSLLDGFTISGGSASYGGCVVIEGASPTLVDLVVEDCGGTYGGGIFVEDGSLRIVGSVIRGNTAYDSPDLDDYIGYGGGIALYGSDAVLVDLTFEGNYAEVLGGGLLVVRSTATLRQVVMKDNYANWYAYWSGSGGGGLMVHSGSAALENVLIVDNATGWPDHGGGVDAYESELTLTNVTIADNSATSGAGGGLMLIASEATLTNTVVAGNEALGGGGLCLLEESTLTLRYSDVWGNDPDDYYGVTDPTGTDGNVSVDPEFLDASYHLAATSPLIDAGDPDLLDPDGSPSDIGAWGGPEADGWDLDGDGYNSWWLPGDYDATTSPELDCDDGDEDVYPGRGC